MSNNARLTAEQVEELRKIHSLNLAIHSESFNALCDAALRGLAPSAIGASDSALLPGLREALKWKPNTPQLENAMTYAWASAIKSFIRALEAAAPVTPRAEEAPSRDAVGHLSQNGESK